MVLKLLLKIKLIHRYVSIYISNARFSAPDQTKPNQTKPDQTRVPNLSNTKYFLFANIFRRITPFKKSTTYLDLALKDKHNEAAGRTREAGAIILLLLLFLLLLLLQWFRWAPERLKLP